jgi:hypothetical protein
MPHSVCCGGVALETLNFRATAIVQNVNACADK